MIRGVRLTTQLLLLFYLQMSFLTSASAQSPCTTETPATDVLRIEYLGHASFRFTDDTGTSLIIDPYQDRKWIGYAFPEGVDADAYAVTHPHYDHNATPSTFDDNEILKDPGTYNVGNITITGFAGRHAKRYGRRFKHKNTMFLFEYAGLRWLHLGDNGAIDPDFAKSIQPIDFLFIPIDDEEHLLTDTEVSNMLMNFMPKVTVPMHYRLNELEPLPNKPKDLGDISDYLAGLDSYSELPGYCTEVSAEMAVWSNATWVLRPHPDIEN